jgi:YMGG-like Gly-zipper
MRYRVVISALTCLGLLANCAQVGLTTREQRIGYDNGTDTCRPQLVALDSTGNFFGADILKGAGIGALGGALAGGLIGGDWRGALIGAGAGAFTGAAVGYWQAVQQRQRDQSALIAQVQSDLSRENAEIDRTQLAFDQLIDCRFRQAQAINTAYLGHTLDRSTAEAQMAMMRQRAQHDVALAQQINTKIQQRGQQFEVAAENLNPTARAEIAAVKSTPTQRTVVRGVTALRLEPNSGAPQITELQQQQPVTITGERNGYAVAQTESGAMGYVPIEDLQSPSSGRRSAALSGPAASSSGAGDVRTLAGSNAARRDDFAQSVAVAEQAAQSGFQLAA